MSKPAAANPSPSPPRSEEHTSELQSLRHLVCRLLLEKKNNHGGEVIGGREAPAAEGQHADSDPHRFRDGNVPGLPVLGSDIALAKQYERHRRIGPAS